MSSKFDTCIYAEYFGDYGMNLCNHPSRGKDKTIFEGDCRKCKFHLTSGKALKECPFCGKRVSLGQWGGNWHVSCDKCGLEMKNRDIEELLEKWNIRNP